MGPSLLRKPPLVQVAGNAVKLVELLPSAALAPLPQQRSRNFIVPVPGGLSTAIQ